MQERSRHTTTILFAGKLAVSLSLFTALFFVIRKDLAGIAAIMHSARPAWYIIAFGSYFLATVFISQRLRYSLLIQGVKTSQVGVLYLSLVGFFFNNFMPTSVGGDVVKIFYVSRASGKTLACTSAVLMDRLFGVLTFTVIAAGALCFIKEFIVPGPIKIVIAVFLAVFALVALFIIDGKSTRRFSFLLKPFAFLRAEERLEKFHATLAVYKKAPKKVAAMCVFSLLAQVSAVATAWFLSKSINCSLDFFILFFTLPLIALFTMLPSLNGLGIRESGYVFFFGSLVGRDFAFALSMLMLSQIILLSVIGGIFYLVRDTIPIMHTKTP